MNRLKSVLISYIAPIVAVAVVALMASSYNKKDKHASMHLCKHQYALCTSALCVPQPGDPKKAVCFCDVEEGASMAQVECSKLEPKTDSHGIRTVYSTFSLKQFTEGKQGMKCPSGTPWTWCLDKKCTVNPSDPKKAICTCDVVRTEEWTTLGGNCDTATCKTGYWSGAAIKDFDKGNAFMTKALGLDPSPAKWCPAG